MFFEKSFLAFSTSFLALSLSIQTEFVSTFIYAKQPRLWSFLNRERQKIKRLNNLCLPFNHSVTQYAIVNHIIMLVLSDVEGVVVLACPKTMEPLQWNEALKGISDIILLNMKSCMF